MEKNDRQTPVWGSSMLKFSLAMKLATILSIVSVFSVQARSYSQKTKVTLDMEQVKMYKVFERIEAHTPYKFLYNTEKIDAERLVTIRAKNKPLEDLLKDFFKNKGIDYVFKNQQIILKPIQLSIREGQSSMAIEDISPDSEVVQMTISGTVTDSGGEPLPGVSVVEKNTTNGVATDFDGNYSIEVSSSSAILVFSYIGMKPVERTVGTNTTLNIQLQEDAEALNEVIIVGYGSQTRKDLTGAISVVGSEDYEDQPVTRVDQILQGRTAGVNVTNSSGAPGGTVSIRIRGANSINGSNEPLYVIDGFVGADFRDVNPADIESMQVLKDASSTAIYGSRGSNGVVLITTKSGRMGKPRISFTSRLSVANLIKEWDLLDAATFAEVVNARASDFGLAPKFTQEEIDNFRVNGGTDWQDLLFRTGFGQEYQLDYSGGKEGVSYFVSGNYLDQEGIVVNSDYTKFGLRANVKANLSDKLTADIKTNFNRRETNNVNGSGNTSGSLAGPLTWAPTTPARDEMGQFTVRDPISSIKANPLESALNDRISEVSTFTTNGSLNYEFFEGLTFNVGFGLSYSNAQTKNFTLGLANETATATRSSMESLFVQNTNNLTYKKNFNGVHDLTVTAVFENQSREIDGFSTDASNLLFPVFRYDNLNLVGSSSSTAIKSKETLLSYIGRLNYEYMDKYLLTLSVRSDGSSKFRGDNKYSTFPSVALGWRISEEDFMQESFFDELKLRASWGQTGSQAIAPFGTITTLNTDPNTAGASYLNGSLTPGFVLGNPGNADLRWETTSQLNFGVDMGFFNNRLGVTMDYYEKSTEDLLLNQPLPDYVGGGEIVKNVGQVDNSGFELGINATVIDNGSFTWDTTFNAAFLTNEVVGLGDRSEIFLSGGVGAGLTNQPENILTPGESLSTYWGLRYLGTWKSDQATEAAVYGNVPGDSRYEDINGDNSINADDMQIIGNGTPTATYGWNNIISYKDFTLNLFFNAMTGFDKWNFGYATGVMPNVDARESVHVDILNRWAPGNEDSDIPHFSPTSLEEIQSSRFVEKGDFVRLKNVSLSYNLPQETLKGIDMQVILSGTNLWTITDYKGLDPEAYSNNGIGDSSGGDAGSYPNSKTWTLGVKLNF